jgi:hypothetical protein
MYRNIRAAEYPEERAAKTFVEGLWTLTAEYLDADVQSSAQRHFLARFWEMYVTAALLERGLPLTPTRNRDLRAGGPDVLIADPRCYLECVIATAGTGRDAVEAPKPFVVTYVPRERIILRIRAAISEKLNKYQRYIANGVLSEHDPYVIAINGSAIPMARGEPDMPYVVAAVLPFGRQQYHLDEAFEVVGSSFQEERELLKLSGSSVPTDIFLGDEHTGISAVVYGHVDPVRRGDTPGSEFIVVHNPTAKNPLPRGMLPNYLEFWVEDEHVRVTDARSA